MESKLQIISGKWRGKKLWLPANARPTQNKARIALFNMLGAQRRAVVWDAFAGSGAFGIECLSRGIAERVIFTDTDSESIKTVKKNLNNVGADIIRPIAAKRRQSFFAPLAQNWAHDMRPYNNDFATVKQTDAIAAVKEFGPAADLIFIDPPYSAPLLAEKFIAALTPVAKPGTILICEVEAPKPAQANSLHSALKDELLAEWTILKDKTYGRARFVFLGTGQG